MPSCAPWDRRVHEVIPQGERRALPAPAQGSRPLRIPFWGEASVSPVSLPKNRRRRTAPARGPSAVYTLYRRNRNETKQVRPLLMGLGCVYMPPKATGCRHCRPPVTSVSLSPQPPQAASPCSWACRRLHARPPHQKRNEAPKPPAHVAWVRVHAAEGYWLPALPAPRDLRLPVSPTAAGGKSLLVDLPPSARTVAPFGTKRSAQAPCSWGLGASPRRQRLWLPAPPARPYAKILYIIS